MAKASNDSNEPISEMCKKRKPLGAISPGNGRVFAEINRHLVDCYAAAND